MLKGHEVEVSRHGAVKVDGAATELPWQKMDELSGNVLIQAQRWDHAVLLKTMDGIKVGPDPVPDTADGGLVEISCDWYYHKCSITLSGHYHGKTAGLLGSNDNEPSNDWDLPDGSTAADVHALGKGWHTGAAKCNSVCLPPHFPALLLQEKGGGLFQVDSVASPSGPEHEECTANFESLSSPFAPCFRHVNPAPFLAMCEVGRLSPRQQQANFGTDESGHLTQMGTAFAPAENVVCNVSSAYTTACCWAGIELSMPPSCIW